MKINIKFLLLTFIVSSCAFEDPYFMTIDIYEDDPYVMNKRVIAINGKWADIENIPIAVYLETKDLDSVQKTKFFVKLKINKNASMGVVSDVKSELINADVKNVRYYNFDKKTRWVHQ